MFFCFFCFFVFLALFIDLLTDQVQPLFKNSQVAAPPSTRTSCVVPRPVICCCRWKRCGGNGRTGKRGDIHLHKILIPFDASCFWTFLFVEPTNHFFFGTIDSRAKILSEEDKKTKEVALQDKLDRSNRRYLLRKRCGVEVDMEQARELVGQKLEIYFVSEARWRLGTVRGTFLKFNRSI